MAKNSGIDKSIDPNYNSPFSYDNEIVKKIPLIGEKFSYTKQTKEDQINIEKRWTTSIKKVEIPVSYEEIYIDGKKIDTLDKKEVVKIFKVIKNKIKDVFSHSKNQERVDSSDLLKVKHYDADSTMINEKKNIENVKSMPLSFVTKNPKTEDVITIWGEEIIINKRKVKLGEFVIKKYEVTETKKVEVELITEKLTIHQPDTSKEEII
jgi:stress response protein YsnF